MRSWINVVVAAVIMLATLPGRTQGLGLITEPMLRDLHLDRVSYATINLWATLLGAVVCLPIGRVFDRLGLRWPTIALTVGLAAVVWAMSRLAGGYWALFALIFATRALGQSALSVSSITTVGKSFDRRSGLPMGVYAVLLSLLFAAAFAYTGTSVRVDGWRVAWAQVATGLVVIAAPMILLLQEPQTLEPQSRGVRAADHAPETLRGSTLAEALQTPAFWIFGIAISLFGLAQAGLGLFNEAVLAERGFPQAIYVTFVAATFGFGLLGQFGCGWAALHWPMPRLLALSMGLYALALIGLPFVTTLSHVWMIAVLLGLSGGMITVLFFAVWGATFGQLHLGRIQGAAQMLTVVASAIGPLIFAKGHDLTGSYAPPLWVLAPCAVLTGLAALRLRPVRAASL
jgi:MFS family permease